MRQKLSCENCQAPFRPLLTKDRLSERGTIPRAYATGIVPATGPGAMDFRRMTEAGMARQFRSRKRHEMVLTAGTGRVFSRSRFRVNGSTPLCEDRTVPRHHRFLTYG